MTTACIGAHHSRRAPSFSTSNFDGYNPSISLLYNQTVTIVGNGAVLDAAFKASTKGGASFFFVWALGRPCWAHEKADYEERRAHIPIKGRTWAVIWCYSGYSARSYIPVLGAWLIPGALGGAGPALNLAAKNSLAPRRDDSLF